MQLTTLAIVNEIERLNKVLDVPYDHDAGWTRKAVQFLAALLPVVAWGERCGVIVERADIADLNALCRFVKHNRAARGRAMEAVMVPLLLYIDHLPQSVAEDQYRYCTMALQL